jgi:hypothetical protein
MMVSPRRGLDHALALTPATGTTRLPTNIMHRSRYTRVLHLPSSVSPIPQLPHIIPPPPPNGIIPPLPVPNQDRASPIV